MQLYRIENIQLKPLLVFARDPDDAANILAHAFVLGMSHRPDADFDVVNWDTALTHWPEPLIEWQQEGYRGIVWCVDDGGWELTSTGLIKP